jgi:hypothetical protein
MSQGGTETMLDELAEGMDVPVALLQQLQTYAVALNLACQDLVDDPDDLGELIGMYLDDSRSFLASSEGIEHVNRSYLEIEKILCAQTHDDY